MSILTVSITYHIIDNIDEYLKKLGKLIEHVVVENRISKCNPRIHSRVLFEY